MVRMGCPCTNQRRCRSLAIPLFGKRSTKCAGMLSTCSPPLAANRTKSVSNCRAKPRWARLNQTSFSSETDCAIESGMTSSANSILGPKARPSNERPSIASSLPFNRTASALFAAKQWSRRKCDGITLRTAAYGQGCEVAHIIPKGSGGHNGLSNIVLAHDKCNRKMARRTPRQYWEADTNGGFDEGMTWIEHIYGDVERPKPAEVKSGNSLWACYFNRREDVAKIERFKKDITDIQGMTERQDAATKYATRQVMAYLADALFEGNGLPERGGQRRIFATDGRWTAWLRSEWGLKFRSPRISGPRSRW